MNDFPLIKILVRGIYEIVLEANASSVRGTIFLNGTELSTMTLDTEVKGDCVDDEVVEELVFELMYFANEQVGRFAA